MSKITIDRLREVLHYNPETGVWLWRISRPKAGAGTRAGTVKNQSGYRCIRIDGHFYRSARLAFFYMTGEWPSACVDHVNLIRGDDRWANLRQASHTQNNGNRRAMRNNKCGLKGVWWIASLGKWRARICKNGVRKHLGLFPSKEEAHAAYCVAAENAFNDFARAA